MAHRGGEAALGAFPAPAGMNRRRLKRSLPKWCVPRTRGDEPPVARLHNIRWERSPHPRDAPRTVDFAGRAPGRSRTRGDEPQNPFVGADLAGRSPHRRDEPKTTCRATIPGFSHARSFRVGLEL